MTADRNAEYLAGLVRELCKLPHETEWVEFKVNNSDPQEIGEYLSALANAAAINGKAFAYLVWGVANKTHDIVGTNFAPASTRKGNEPLETWLLRLLTPKIHFRFHELVLDGLPVVLLEIGRAFRHPLRFQNDEFIRFGAVKKPLKEAPDIERALWRIFDQTRGRRRRDDRGPGSERRNEDQELLAILGRAWLGRSGETCLMNGFPGTGLFLGVSRKVFMFNMLRVNRLLDGCLIGSAAAVSRTRPT